MTASSIPPRPSLATLLRAPSPAGSDAGEAVESSGPDAAIEEWPQAVTVDAPSAEPVDAAALAEDPPPQPGPEPAPAPVAAPVSDTPPPAFAAAAARPAPSFARRRDHAPSRGQWLALAGLVLLLVLQVTLADRARLAGQASTRPLVEALCTVLRCSLPAWHEPSAFTMLSREIRPVPGVPGALQVSASFRNEARWAQDWPVLQLALADADGRTIGQGRFQPRDYLGQAPAAGQRLVPGQSAQVSFRIREPAAATVAFTFEFQ